jgi:hypothetical protein
VIARGAGLAPIVVASVALLALAPSALAAARTPLPRFQSGSNLSETQLTSEHLRSLDQAESDLS